MISAYFTNLNVTCAMQVIYVDFTCRHPHQRVEEHKNSSSSNGRHFRDKHFLATKDLTKYFSVLMKFTNTFDCLVHEMCFSRPTLNVQLDSIRDNVFHQLLISFLLSFCFVCFLLSVYTCKSFYTRYMQICIFIVSILPFT